MDFMLRAGQNGFYEECYHRYSRLSDKVTYGGRCTTLDTVYNPRMEPRAEPSAPNSGYKQTLDKHDRPP